MARPLPIQIVDHLLPWARMRWPVDWESIFGRHAELALEIGFGNGRFLVDQARSHPDRDYVGVEVSWGSATRLFDRIDSDFVRNVRVCLIEARVALECLFAPESLCEVFLNHPCPWPKTRHRSRRLLDASFLELLSSRMRTGAELLIVTDHASYSEWIAKRLARQPTITSCHDRPESASPPGRTPTKYEAQAIARGLPIHYFHWTKHRAGPLRPARAREPSLQCLTLLGTLSRPEPWAGLLPRTWRESNDGVDVLVRLGPTWRGDAPGLWMIEALVIEGALQQHFAILVDASRAGTVRLQHAHLAEPHPTWGIKRAIWLASELLRESSPTLEVLRENLGRSATGPSPHD
jgi:tRNA (guanine-N7-)-methyltransferase